MEGKINEKKVNFGRINDRDRYLQLCDLKRILSLLYKSRSECLAKLDYIAKKEIERIKKAEERRMHQRASFHRGRDEGRYDYYEEYEIEYEDQDWFLEEEVDAGYEYLEDKEVDLGYADEMSWEDRG